MESAITQNGRVELLNGDNYYNWAVKMRAILKAKRLYKTIIEGEIPTKPADLTSQEGKKWLEWEERNDDAFSILILSLTPEHAGMFADEGSAKKMWTELEVMYAGNKQDRIVDAMLELKDVKMMANENVGHYIMRVKGLRSKIFSLGGNMDEREFIFYVVRGIHYRLENVAVVLRTRRNVTLEEIHMILREEENRTNQLGNRSKTTGMEEAYKTRDTRRNPTHRNNNKHKECYICKKVGHLSRDCWFRKEGNNIQNENRNSANPKNKTHAKSAEHEQEAAMSARRGYQKPLTMMKNYERWNLDSGCTIHMTSNPDNLCNIQTYESEIQMAEQGWKISANQKGELHIKIKQEDGDKKVKLHNVLFVPKLKDNLISVRELIHQGNSVIFNAEGATIFGPMGEVLVKAKEYQGMYTLLMQRTPHSDIILNDNAWRGVTNIPNHTLWHRRLGHVSEEYLKTMKKHNIVIGLNFDMKKSIQCTDCILGKLSRKPFKPNPGIHATRPLELVHLDLCGPLPVPSLGGNLYIMVIVDTFTRRIFIKLLKNKCDAFSAFVNFKVRREKEMNIPICKVRTDNGLEFLNHKFENLFKRDGIKHEMTVAYSPQSNGLAERTNRTLLDSARTMLIAAGLPDNFWGEAILTAAYLKNRTFRKGLNNLSPMEKWNNRKPTIRHLRIFGCLCHYWINKFRRDKLDAKANSGILVGYSQNRVAYRVYCPTSGKIVETRDVQFEEDTKGNILLNDEGSKISIDQLTYISPETLEINKRLTDSDNNDTNGYGSQEDLSEQEQLDRGPGDDSQQQVERRTMPQEPDKSKPRGRPKGTVMGVVSTRSKEETQQKEQELQERGVRRSTRIKEKDTVQPIHNETSNFAEINVPNTFEQALKSDENERWLIAMEDELQSLDKMKVWNLVDRKPGMRVIKNKWVYAVKRGLGTDEKDLRYKARLVAVGNRQREGIDYTTTYAPVIKSESMRLLIAIAAQFNMEIVRYDVKTAYLYGELQEDIFMEQPDGRAKQEGKVCKLIKSLYGLPQSGFNWNVKLNQTLKQLGFERLKSEPSIHIMKNDKDTIYLGVYVDDLLVIGSNETWTKEIMKKLREKFEMREEKGDGEYLGIDIQRTEDGYSIGQRKHIVKLLEQQRMTRCNPTKIPMDVNQRIEDCVDSKDIDKTKYQELIGSLMYLANGTRPDIAFGVNYLSQFCQKPKEVHGNAVRKILKYLNGTKDKRLYFGRDLGQIEIFSDASWSASKDCKSRSGYCVKLANSLIDWKSKKQALVALSSCEAELNAICEAVKEAEWLRNVITELGLEKMINKPIQIHTDSQAAIDWANCQSVKQRTKHFARKLYKIRDEIEENGVSLVYKPGKEIEADVLTKAVSSGKMEKACELFVLR